MSSDEDEDYDGWKESSCDEDDFSQNSGAEEDFKFETEMGAFGEGGRVGPENNILVGNAPRNYIERNMMTSLEKFTLYVNAIAHNLNNNCDEVQLNDNDFNTMLSTASKLDNVGHKNPAAYILGYIATRVNKTLDIKYFNVVSKLISKNEKAIPQIENVSKEDIVKYSRLWERLYLK